MPNGPQHSEEVIDLPVHGSVGSRQPVRHVDAFAGGRVDVFRVAGGKLKITLPSQNGPDGVGEVPAVLPAQARSLIGRFLR